MLRSTPHSSVRTSRPAMDDTVSSRKSAPTERAILPTSAATPRAAPGSPARAPARRSAGRTESRAAGSSPGSPGRGSRWGRGSSGRDACGTGPNSSWRARASPMLHQILPLILRAGSGVSDALRVAVDEVEVTRVDEEARTLAQDEHRVEPVDRVRQQREAATHRKEPEGAGND